MQQVSIDWIHVVVGFVAWALTYWLSKRQPNVTPTTPTPTTPNVLPSTPTLPNLGNGLLPAVLDAVLRELQKQQNATPVASSHIVPVTARLHVDLPRDVSPMA